MCTCLWYTQVWNDAWVAEAEQDESMYYWLLGFTGAAYLGAITLAGAHLDWCTQQAHPIVAQAPL